MFRVIKESEYVDERQHCFLLQTVGRESRYFSMETRQELLRLESAWHRAVCQAVSTLEVSLKSTKCTNLLHFIQFTFHMKKYHLSPVLTFYVITLSNLVMGFPPQDIITS